MGLLVKLMPILESVERTLANILNLMNKADHRDTNRDVNPVMLVYISQNLTLESLNLENKVGSTILTAKLSHNTAAQ